MAQIPQGPKDLWCPFWRKRMCDVCHTCPLWVQLRGKRPQAEAEFDEWSCAVRWLPDLLVENAQQARQAGASTDKVATEIKNFHSSMSKQNAQMATLLTGPGAE